MKHPLLRSCYLSLLCYCALACESGLQHTEKRGVVKERATEQVDKNSADSDAVLDPAEQPSGSIDTIGKTIDPSPDPVRQPSPEPSPSDSMDSTSPEPKVARLFNGDIDAKISDGWVKQESLNSYGSERPTFGEVSGVLLQSDGKILVWKNAYFYRSDISPEETFFRHLEDGADYRYTEPYYAEVSVLEAETGNQDLTVKPVLFINRTNLFGNFTQQGEVLFAGTTEAISRDGTPSQRAMIYNREGKRSSFAISYGSLQTVDSLALQGVAVSATDYAVCGNQLVGIAASGFVARYQFARGTERWEQPLVEQGNNLECHDIVYDEVGDSIYIAASSRAAQSAYIFRYTAAGELIWKVVLNDTKPNRVQLMLAGRRLLVSYSAHPDPVHSAGMVTVLDPEGNQTCSLDFTRREESYMKTSKVSGDVIYSLISLPNRSRRGDPVVQTNSLILYRSNLSSCERGKEPYFLTDTIKSARLTLGENRIYVYGSWYLDSTQSLIRELVLEKEN